MIIPFLLMALWLWQGHRLFPHQEPVRKAAAWKRYGGLAAGIGLLAWQLWALNERFAAQQVPHALLKEATVPTLPMPKLPSGEYKDQRYLLHAVTIFRSYDRVHLADFQEKILDLSKGENSFEHTFKAPRCLMHYQLRLDSNRLPATASKSASTTASSAASSATMVTSKSRKNPVEACKMSLLMYSHGVMNAGSNADSSTTRNQKIDNQSKKRKKEYENISTCIASASLLYSRTGRGSQK